MDTQVELDNSDCFTVIVEVTSDDPQNADPTSVDAVERDAMDALRKEGYTVEPMYIRQRGGGFLVNGLATI